MERRDDILTTCKAINIATCMLVSGIFKQLKTFVDVLNGWTDYPGYRIFSSDIMYYFSIG